MSAIETNVSLTDRVRRERGGKRGRLERERGGGGGGGCLVVVVVEKKKKKERGGREAGETSPFPGSL